MHPLLCRPPVAVSIFAWLLAVALGMPGDAFASSKAPQLESLPLQSGKVAFTYTTEYSQGIWELDFSTRSITPLVARAARDRQPAWSPDGARLAFSSGTQRNRNIFVREPDGTIRRLTKGVGIDEHPSWSPDGNTIVFQSTRYGKTFDLFTISSGGGDEQSLLVNAHQKERPRWSPDGKWIAFTTKQFWPGWDIMLIAPDSLETKPLSHGHRSYLAPSWSSDARRLVYLRGSRKHNSLWEIQTETRKQRRLYRSGQGRFDPVYASGGKGVLFVQEVHLGRRDYHLFYLDLSTNTVTQVTKGLGIVRDLSFTEQTSAPTQAADY